MRYLIEVLKVEWKLASKTAGTKINPKVYKSKPKNIDNLKERCDPISPLLQN